MKVIISLLLGVVCVVLAAQADPRVWGPEGIPVRQGLHLEWNQGMAQDAGGNTLLVWSDMRFGNRDIRAQLVNSVGEEQWPAGGVNVCPHDRQQDLPVAVAVNGGWIVAWVDMRNSIGDDVYTDVFAQKLDYAGNRLWADNDFTGVAVDVANRRISVGSLQIVPDGAGGAIVAWMDYRYRSNVYAQRITANGDIAWTPVLAVTDSLYAYGLSAAPGADGSMLLSWERYNAGDDIYAARVAPDGSLPWGENGVEVCTAAGDQDAAQVVADGADGCYLVWRDSRTGYGQIYGQRLHSDGQPWWTVNGVPLYTLLVSAYDIAFTASYASGNCDGFVVAWQDFRTNYDRPEIYAQKVTPLGATVWPENGVHVAGNASTISCGNLAITSDHNGGLVCVWENLGATGLYSDARLFATRLQADGTNAWAAGGVPVADPVHRQHRAIVGGDFGIYTVAFYDFDTVGVEGIRYQQLNHFGGTRLLGEGGIATVSGIGKGARTSCSASLSGHRTAIVWQDDRLGIRGTAFYYQVIGPFGEVERVENGEMLAGDNTGHHQYYQERARTCDDGSGGVFVSFVDNRWGIKLIRLAHISSDGEVMSPDSGVLVWWTPGIRDQVDSRCTPDGEGGVYVGWSGYTTNFWIELYIMRLDANLQQMWEQPVQLTESYADDNVYALVVSADNYCIAVWQSGELGDYNISAARICGDGTVAWNDTLCDAPGDQDNATAVSDGSDGVYVAWQDGRTPSNELDIFAQRIAADGTPYWTPNGILVNAGEQNQWYPQIAMDSRGDLCIAWQDFRNGEDVHSFAQKLSPSGELRWPGSGVPVALSGHVGDLTMAASEGRDGIYPIWSRDHAQGHDLLATHLDSTGSVYGDPFWIPDSGGPVVDFSYGKYQDAPSLTPDGWGGCVIAWTQITATEGEPALDIYAQRIFDYATHAVMPDNPIPHDYALYQNYPNPFNPATTIAFDLPQAGQARLGVYDLLGREVRVLTDAPLAAGAHRVTFDASALPSGVYVYRLEAGDFRQAKKLVLLR